MNKHNDSTKAPGLQDLLLLVRDMMSMIPDVDEEAINEVTDLETGIKALRNISQNLAQWHIQQQKVENRLNELMEVIISIASLDFSRKVDVSERGDLFDAVGTGLNALAEELIDSTVSKHYLDDIVESLMDILVVTDESGTIQLVNQATIQKLGYDRPDLIGKHISLLCPECNHLQKLVDTTNPKIFRSNTGEEIPVLFSASTLHSPIGALQGYVCTAQDISELTRVQHALWERNAQLLTLHKAGTAIASSLRIHDVAKMIAIELSSLLNFDQCTVYQVDSDRDILQPLAVIGLPEDQSIEVLTSVVLLKNSPYFKQVIDTQVAIQTTRSDPNLEAALNARIQDAGFKTVVILPILHLDKVIAIAKLVDQEEERTLDENLVMIGQLLLNTGAVALENARLYQESQQEILDRERAERALRESESRLAEAQQIAHIGHWDWNIITNDLFWSDEIYRIFGLKPQQFGATYDAFMERIHPDDREAVQLAVDKALKGENYSIDHKISLPDGTVRHVHEQGIVTYNTSGEPIRMIGTVQDITDRKQTEDALRESEARLGEAQRIAHIGNWDWDIITNDLFWSDEIYRIFGLERGDFERTYDAFMERVHPDDRPSLQAAIDRAIEGDSYSVDHRILLPSGEVRLVKEQGEIVRDQAGKPVHMVGVTQDVTERRRAEHDLKEANRLLQAIFDTTHVLVAYLDHNFDFLMVNQAYADADNHEPSYFIGKNHFDLYPNEENEAIFKKVLESGKAHHVMARPFEYAHNPERGVTHWDWSLVPTYDSSGKASGVVLTLLNVTERIKAVEALNASEKALRALLDGTQDTVLLINTDGDILASNEAFGAMVSRPVAELVGENIYKVLDAEVTNTRRELGQLVINTKQPQRFEDFQNGRYYENTIYPVQENSGDVTRLALFSHDITERKLAEQAIVEMNEELERRVKYRTAELSKANEEIRQFAYIVSHDLRSPLVNLKGFSTELAYSVKDVKEELGEILNNVPVEKRNRIQTIFDEDIPEAIEFINTSVSRMDTFTSAILQLSRLGRRDLDLKEIDLNSIFQDYLTSLAYSIEQKQVKIILDELPSVIADKVAMEQIVGNILGNAINYLDPSRPGVIKIYGEKDEEKVTINIRDNGRGIAESDMHKVFAPFRRAGKQDVKGEGMGLAYVQTLVRRHGGHIYCESVLGTGTTMTFTIAQQFVGTVSNNG